MKSILHLATFFALVCPNYEARATELETRTETVERVRDGMIFTVSAKLFRPDDGTKIVKKTATGEAEAKLTDLKEGDAIEIQTEKGREGIKRIIIQKAKK